MVSKIIPLTTAFIVSATPDTARGAGVNIGEQYAASAIYRTLLKPDFTGVSPTANIISAKLTLEITADFSVTATYVDTYRILRNWNQAQVTWNSYTAGNAWGTAGASAATDIDTSFGAWGSSRQITDAETAGTLIDISLNTAEVMKLLNGTYNNYGWLLKTRTETDTLYLYGSSILTIEYSDNSTPSMSVSDENGVTI